MARILEALEANMWSGLRMKPPRESAAYVNSSTASDAPSHNGSVGDREVSQTEEMRQAAGGIESANRAAAGAPMRAAAAKGDVSGGSGGEFLRGPEILAFRELLEAESCTLETGQQIAQEELETEKLAQMMSSFAGESCCHSA